MPETVAPAPRVVLRKFNPYYIGMAYLMSGPDADLLYGFSLQCKEGDQIIAEHEADPSTPDFWKLAHVGG